MFRVGIDSSEEVDVSTAFSLTFPLSAFDVRLNMALKVGAAGLSLGVMGLWEEAGRVPMTPTGGGLDCPNVVSGGKNSSSSLATPVVKAVVDPC